MLGHNLLDMLVFVQFYILLREKSFGIHLFRQFNWDGYDFYFKLLK